MQSKLTQYVDTDGATVTMDFNVSHLHRVTIAGNRTFVFSNPVAGETYTIIITQDGVGSRTVTWPSTVKWGAAAPTLTTTAGRSDKISFLWDGTNYLNETITQNHNIA